MTFGPYQLYLIAFAVCCALICAYAGFKLGQMIQRWAITRRRLDESRGRTVKMNTRDEWGVIKSPDRFGVVRRYDMTNERFLDEPTPTP